MAHNLYHHLVNELASLLGLAGHNGQIQSSGNLLIRGVAVTMAFNDQKPECVHVYVDFGDFPQHRALEILRRLLEINLLVAPEGSPRLGLQPESGRVVFCWSRPLAGLTAQTLLGSIDMAVSQALEWRSHFYLDDAPRASQDMRHALHV